MFRLTDANEDNRLEVASLTVKERQRYHLAPATGIIARGCVYRGLYAFENGGVTVGADLPDCVNMICFLSLRSEKRYHEN